MKTLILALFTLISVNLFSQTSTINAEKYMIIPKNQSSKTRFITDNVYAKNKLCIGCDTSKSASNSFPFWATTDARFDGKIYVGGSYGQNGNVLMSRGSSLSPIWGSLDYNTLSNKPSLDMFWQKNNLFGVSGYVFGSDQTFVSLGADGQKVAQWNKNATTGKLSGFSQIAINSGFNLFTSETVGGYQFEVGGRGVFGYNPNMPTTQKNNNYYKLMLAKQTDADISVLNFGKWESSGQTYVNRWNVTNDNSNRLTFEKNGDIYPFAIDTTSSAYFGQNRFIFGGKYGVDDAKFVIRGKLAIVDGTQGEDYIYSSNSRGLGSWRSKSSLNIQGKIDGYNGYDETNAGHVLTSDAGAISWRKISYTDLLNTPSLNYLPLTGGTITTNNLVLNGVKLSGVDASGTNIQGGNIEYSAGRGTGSASGGTHIWYSSFGSITGSTLRSYAEIMRLTPQGRLGINNSNPTVNLDLGGDFKASGTIFLPNYANGFLKVNSGTVSSSNIEISDVNSLSSTLSTYLPLSGGTLSNSIRDVLELNTTNTNGVSMIFRNNSTAFGKIGSAYYDVNGSALSDLQLNATNSGKIHLVTGGFSRLAITSTGNVGIGTASATEKFHVVGNGLFTGLLTGTGSAQFSGTLPIMSNSGIYLGTSGSFPYVGLRNQSATTDNKLWDVYADGTTLYNRVVNDANSVATTWQQVVRNGATISSVSIPNGNVGIGTTNGSQRLSVNGNIRIVGNNSLRWGQGFQYIVADTTASTLSFGSNGAINMSLVNGDVGIGTNLPTEKLDVNGSLKVVNGGKFIGQAGTWHNGGQVLIDYATNQGRIQSYDGVSSQNKDLLLQWNGGNIGIGTNLPTEKLDINGSLKVVNGGKFIGQTGSWHNGGQVLIDYASGGRIQAYDGALSQNKDLLLQWNGGNIGIGTTTPTSKLTVSTANATNGIELANSSLSNRSWLFYPVTNGTNTDMRLYETAGSSGDRVTFQSGGSIGVGTTTPAEKLHIENGKVYIKANDARMRLYNNGAVAEWQLGQKSISSHNFTLSKFVSGVDTEYLTITTSGNIGIGTANPQDKIHISGGNIRFSFDSGNNYNAKITPTWNTSVDSKLSFGINATSTGSVVESFHVYANGTFRTNALTTAQINALPTPIEGMTVWNSDLKTWCFWNGTSWQKVTSSNM